LGAIPGELIPLAAILVGGIAVIGRVIVQPIVQALLKLNEQRQVPPADTSGLAQRLGTLEEQQQRLERSLDRLLQDREFYQQLQAGKPRTELPPTP
jgi:hypothetical protein